MKNPLRIVQVILISLALLTAGAKAGEAPAEAPVYSWGAPANGLRIGVAMVGSDTGASPSSAVMIAFENMAGSSSDPHSKDSEMALKLGDIYHDYGNWTVLKNISLLVTKPDGSIRVFEDLEDIVGASSHPYTALLSPGTIFRISQPVKNFGFTSNPGEKFGVLMNLYDFLPSGSYHLAVQFKFVSDHSPDSANFWVGTATSGAIPFTVKKPIEKPQAQSARTIARMMFQYSLDNDGKYSHGQSSTEVFQQLIDQSYVADPSVFYFPMPGKTKPTSNKLKPENVCWDVTDGAQSGDPDNLPVVFTTGYKINYETDFGHATLAYPLTKPALPGIVVGFMNNSSSFVPATADGVLLINSTFDPKGKTYRQLTPNGPLH